MSGPSLTVGRLKAVPATPIPIAPAVAKTTPTEECRSPAPAYRVATTLSAVLEAWRFVYDCRRDQRTIEENPFELDTTQQAASPGSTVLCAYAEEAIVSTLTITRDGARGLALDASFGRELDRIRGAGQRLSEVGLMATRGAPNGLDRLLAISLDCALRDDYSAVVMAVEARHAAYYERKFGFENRERPLSPRSRASLQLIRVDREAFLRSAKPPPGVRALRASPVRANFCAGAFGFLPSQLSGTPLAAYLSDLESRRAQRRSQSVR